jgi:CRISPR-associated protein Cas2
MPKRTLYLAAYDVSDDGRLRQALHAVKGYATGGQKSVFECFLTDAEREELLGRVGEVIDVEDDRFMLVRVESGFPVHTLGVAVTPADPRFYYVG